MINRLLNLLKNNDKKPTWKILIKIPLAIIISYYILSSLSSIGFKNQIKTWVKQEASQVSS
jgi:hypothetical protein